MQWTDEGVILGVRKHGESSIILELMTRGHGRHLGLVHGGRSKSLQAVLQPGNTVQATWRARLDEHLGTYQVEGLNLRAAQLMGSSMALYGLATLAHLLRYFPERDPHFALYETLTVLVDHLDDPDLAPALFVRFELAMLTELGFGLDLSECAATGSTEELIYVSPRSGRAVSKAGAGIYASRLFKLPPFLTGQGSDPPPEDVAAALALTGHFLQTRVLEPHGAEMPQARIRLDSLLSESR